ncbi:class IV adenylate cyclase [Halanaeroarchaeum sulfurireducens]|uniref:Adenylate cyclase n=1 Tax=Halanaeroarchaeum sulfurireducens TaxID=1604004 RepID=A0A0F7PD43_9EURY|nr:class IV adenylate cyclase [Halanaeroarchaeum sulfurireducens]AKH98065.1 adenylate cyclase [Halanaeroarchaeum sulfurireducens]ALG82459.1 adenylate cyclase [Halanaeroarchaeum sulfurireducens]
MYEVEVKVRADHESVRSTLERLDARRRGTVEQTDVYFDAPHRNFAETDEALRLRREVEGEESRTVLTYKGSRVDEESKTREEIEMPIDDVSDAKAILEALGFEPAATVAKTRDRWTLEGYEVALDDVDGLGQYLEVEAEAEEDEIELVRDGAIQVLRSLDLDPDAQIRTSYLGLLLADEGSKNS